MENRKRDANDFFHMGMDIATIKLQDKQEELGLKGPKLEGYKKAVKELQKLNESHREWYKYYDWL